MTAGLVIGTFFDSFFEWALHRYVMHRKLGWLEYSFQRHALVHHRVFQADNTYHLIDEEDKKTVPMAWWNGPLLIALGQVPFAAASWFLGNAGLVCGSLLAGCLYYAAYEYMHWCMHIPRKRTVERSGLFFRLNGHHLLHHRYMNRNFNVVLPLADLCLGTLLLRSKVQFAQARGESVPDVQPIPSRRVG
jgi:hypothetical protein